MALPPNPLQSFIWGRGGAALTPEQVARERAVAESLMAQGIDTSPVGHWTQGAARMANVLAGKLKEGRASSAESEGRTAFSDRLSSILGGSPATSAAMATAPAPDYASARVAQAHGGGGFDGNLRDGIIATAEAIGADPLDLATAISYETAGTFDPAKKGPRTQWGQHRGLIQFGEPQARQHGVDWNDPIGSQLGPDGAIANYFRSSGFKPGMSGLDLYSTINAGAPGRYRASDANNGGAPGNVRDKWENQMSAHRQKAAALLGSLPSTPAATQSNSGLTPEALQQWGLANYAPDQASPAVAANEAMATGSLAGVPVAETEQEILAQEAAMAAQDPMAFQQPDLSAAGPSGMGQGSPGEKRRGPDGQLYQYVETSGMAGASGGWGWIPVADDGSQGDLSGIAQALTANQVNPELPMAGNTSGFLPVAQSLAAQPQQQGGMPNMQQLIELASDPWATDAQRGVVQALLQQQMQAQDPMRQLQMQKLHAEVGQLQNPQPDLTSGQREYNMAVSQGYTGSFMDYKRDLAEAQRAQTNITVGGEGAPGLGKLSPDFGYVLDPSTRQPVIDPATGLPQAAPVPGSPADIAMQEAERMRSGQEGQSQRYGKIVGEDIGRVLAAVEENPNTIAGPLGSLLASVPGTGAHDVSNMLNTIRANVGFDRLQDMRANSPTGGALGAVSDSENKMLQSTLGALEQSQSPKQFATNLRRLQNLYTEIVHGPAPSGVSDDEWTKQAWGLGGGPAPEGVDPEVWEFMTPEERALFK